MAGQIFRVEVQPRIPRQLNRLSDLANDLYYSWSAPTRSLFRSLDEDLWQETGRNPKLFLKRIDQSRLERALHDRTFMVAYNRVLSDYDTYLANVCQDLPETERLGDSDLVAYFCLEFGFHESVPIYSGGLGILAADHCKAASDLNVPLVAIGLMYHQGYFDQRIDRLGHQIAHHTNTDFNDLLLNIVRDADGREIRVTVPLAGRDTYLRIWEAKAGHVRLFLLDSDVPENSPPDCDITCRLYGGDRAMRITQEIVLGIGGTRALRAMGLAPSVWHINEGHAAFLILERCRELVAGGMSFDGAMEAVAAGTVFTTHTPVPAGHDMFSHDLVRQQFGPYIRELGLSDQDFLALGASDAPNLFNMTALALRGSRFRNGVSKIHGKVASRMEGYLWPELSEEDNPIDSITNGVHLHTFLSSRWSSLFDNEFGQEWRNQLLRQEYWERIEGIPDFTFWSTRLALKADLLRWVRRAVLRQFNREGFSQVEVEHVTRLLDPESPDLLIFGFARRFATYKRATLLFQDLERLRRLVTDTNRPVLILIAGKAHPADHPGQELIRHIFQISMDRDFQGRVLVLENYNLGMARNLLSGVDVWLNTPEYPQEASGTSGQKAAFNGVINLSILDGWWGEGYNGQSGWAIKPHPRERDGRLADQVEGQTLLDIIEEQVIPLYYNRDQRGYPGQWVRKAKASMKYIIPRFNASRMVRDYVRFFYKPASSSRRRFADHSRAEALAVWKQRIRQAWPQVQLSLSETPRTELLSGENLRIQVRMSGGGLMPEDVRMDCLFGQLNGHGEFVPETVHPMHSGTESEDGSHLFELHLNGGLSGLRYYKVRLYPYTADLVHPFDMGLMRWL